MGGGERQGRGYTGAYGEAFRSCEEVEKGEGPMRFYCLLLGALLFSTVQVDGQERLEGDVNGDGQVDFFDFILLAENFGETGGETFDPQSWRDTLVVRDTVQVAGPVVYKTVRDTVWRDYVKPVSTIMVEPSGWQGPIVFVQAVCNRVRDIMSESFVFPLDADIIVRRVSPEGPKVLYRRGSHGKYIVWLDTESRQIEQQIYQFSHEYAHILSNYYQITDGRNKWFDESIAALASLYTLRKFHEKLQNPSYRFRVYVPIENVTYYVGNMIESTLLTYAEANISGRYMGDSEFRAWFGENYQALRGNPYLRDLNKMVANNLLPIFEANPDAWNTIRYLNGRGPVSWDVNENFETYLRGWYQRTPARWQKYVAQIATRFGLGHVARKPVLTVDDAGVE